MDVFVSYSSLDKNVADAIVSHLERRKLSCWYAPRDIAAGTEYAAALLNALRHARALVVIVSAKAMASPHVRREVERAVHYGVTVVPFRIEDIPLEGPLEFYLAVPHWLNAMTPPLEAHITRLAETLESLFGSTRPSAMLPPKPSANPSSTQPEQPAAEIAPDDWGRRSGGRVRGFLRKLLDDLE